ncbi:glycine cleavage system protein GcvH [Candidatus Dependentiae bacterium]|nr:glycine cleavage system protein GcvH [Candidatus Dependentiae bacterium]
MELPKNLKYSKEHEWCNIVDGIAVVGITDYAQKELGDVVFVDLPSKNQLVTANEKFGEIESVKAVSDIFSPISGTIIDVNNELSDNPGLVNESPFEKGWMIKVKPSNDSELNNLMTADSYKEYISSL